MFFDQIVEYLIDQQVYSKKQHKLFNALASVFVEFPIENEPPSSAAVALASNCGAALPNALAAGLNCISDQHLPIQQIAEFISDNHRKPVKQRPFLLIFRIAPIHPGISEISNAFTIDLREAQHHLINMTF